MPLGTVFATKEIHPLVPGCPLLLAEFQFIDGSMLYLSTHSLNSSEGGFPYNSNNYQARISQDDIGAIQARSEQGIDRVPSASLHLADSDKFLVTNYEIPSGKGFKGAILTLRLIYWQADTSNFSSDSKIPFVGICDGPQYDQTGRGDVLTITAQGNHNLARAFLPVWQVSPACGNDFPVSASERLLGATDMSHHCWGCGYDPDQAGTDPEIGGDARRGNTTSPNQTDASGRLISDSSGNYIWCNKSKSDCVARGQYTKDSSNRVTGRFNGIQWAPQNREVTSKSYLEGKTIRFTQLGRNDTVFADRFPMLYGTQWVHPVITNVVGDANETRAEFVVCQDYIGDNGFLQVVVNGVIVPWIGSSPDPAIFFWGVVNAGTRNGQPNQVALYDSMGDPYGSLATGVLSIYRELADSGSAPNTMVLALGPQIKMPNTANPSDQPSWPRGLTSNPCWVLLDCLIWTNYRYADIDLQSFIDNAPYCDTAITYTNLSGVTSSHARFKAQFVLEKTKSAAQVVSAIQKSFNAQLSRDPSTGKIKLLIRKTLADQQPSAITGSNYNTALYSVHADGTTGSGYVAYLFDESNILREDPDKPPRIKFYTDASSNAPNELIFGFQDEDNSYAADTLTMKDPDGINRAGGYQSSQEIPEQLDVIGFSNFDQAQRVGNTLLAEILRGNPQGDTRGTYFFEFQCTTRVAHLKTGDIVMFRWQALGLQPATQLQSPPGTNVAGILCRFIQSQPSTNYATASVKLQWHEDLWYTDVYGQMGPIQQTDPRSGLPGRPPYPWQPYGVDPITGDSVFGSPSGYIGGSWWLFGVAQLYQAKADGSKIAQVAITGCPPVNSMSTSGSGGTLPPLVGIQGTTASTGGTIPGGITLYFAIAANDSGLNQTTLSAIFTVVIPAGTNTNTVTSPTIYWQPGSVGYTLYGGTDSNNLSAQAVDLSHTPSNITITGLNLETWGPPDQLADSLHFRGKRVIHGGVWADEVLSVSTGTITFNPHDQSGNLTSFTPHQWFGYDIMLIANANGIVTNVPVANFRVTDNDASSLTVTPDPVAAGITPAMVMMMLTKPSTFTATTVGDANFVNAYGTSGLNVNEGTSILRIIAGTGIGQTRTVISNTSTVYTVDQAFSPIPDATTRFIIEEIPWTEDLDVERIVTASVTPRTWNFDITNFKGQVVIIQVNVEDAQGNSSLQPMAPLRMIYIWGQANVEVTATANYSIQPTDDVILCDTSGGSFTVTLPPSVQAPGKEFAIVKTTSDANTVTVVVGNSGTIVYQGGAVSSLVLANLGDSAVVISNG